MSRVVNVSAADLQPGDEIRTSIWPPYRPATVTAVSENDDASVHVEFRDRDGKVDAIDCADNVLIPTLDLTRFGESAVRAELDEALAKIDDLIDTCACGQRDYRPAQAVGM